ncbi:MAG: hypothetical protein K9G46_02145 [Flavobacteriales bacterium]|nr:hypothetical protein [Flavobacteriales bacterium]
MKKIFFSLLLPSVLIFSGCTEDFEDAKYRCKINGKDFIPSKDLIQFDYTENVGNDRIRIRGTALATSQLSNNPYGEFEIQFSFNDTALAPVELGYDIVYYGNNEWDKTFRSSATDPGTLTITSLDKTAKRVTANFELTAYADDGSTLTITEGFFDQSW